VGTLPGGFLPSRRDSRSNRTLQSTFRTERTAHGLSCHRSRATRGINAQTPMLQARNVDPEENNCQSPRIDSVNRNSCEPFGEIAANGRH
jgi:hypothetical protein